MPHQYFVRKTLMRHKGQDKKHNGKNFKPPSKLYQVVQAERLTLFLALVSLC